LIAGSLPTLPWFVPGVDRREHHVARTEGDVLAADAGEIAFAGQAEANGVGRVPVRGITSLASLSRYAVYIVLTVARLGDRPGLTRMSERRSESSIVTSSAARNRIGSISFL